MSEVHVSKRFAEDPQQEAALLAAVRGRLDEAERLLCVLAVAKIQPELDHLVVTSRRVVAGWRGHLDDADISWPVQIPIEAVADVEVTGFMDNVKVMLANGDGIKVGNFWDAADEEPLRAAIRAAQEGEEDGPGTRPTYELYPLADPGPE
ncbi:MAG: hypothetical protein M3237_14780 [Actinomycetota bacterium]|nr:hypothetical protein [Actinomycetota bacterium]